MPDRRGLMLRRGELALRWLPRMPADAWSWRRHRPSKVARIYLFHVRKTAGTSLANAFLALGGEDPTAVFHRMRHRPHATRSNGLVFVHFERALLEHGTYFFGWSHHPAWYLTLPPNTFTITVLRDPVERVLSLYRYLADPRADEGLPFPAPAADRQWASEDFSTFLQRIPPPALYNQLHTFSATLDPAEAADAVRRCGAYFSTSSFDEGLGYLSERLDLTLTRRSDRASTPVALPCDEDLDRLREMLAPEYRLFELLTRDPGPNLLAPIGELTVPPPPLQPPVAAPDEP